MNKFMEEKVLNNARHYIECRLSSFKLLPTFLVVMVRYRKISFLDRVIIVSNYDRVIRSPSFNMKLPSVIALKNYIAPLSKPSFTRFNVFLRDKFSSVLQ